MKYIYCFLILFTSLNCFARGGGFGGSRSSFSGGGRASVSRSYSAPSRSYSAPVVHTTVVHNGGSGNGLLTGMMIGHMMSNNGNTVVVPAAQGQVGAQVVATQQDTGIGFWGVVGIVLLIFFIIIVFAWAAEWGEL